MLIYTALLYVMPEYTISQKNRESEVNRRNTAGVRVTEDVNNGWGMWAACMVDWSQYYLRGPLVWRTSFTSIAVQSGVQYETLQAIVELALGQKSRYGQVSKACHSRFMSLLRKSTRPILCYPWTHSVKDDPEWKRRIARHEDPWTVAQSFRQFAKDFKDEPVLPAYAVLMAAVIDSRWKKDALAVIKEFRAIEQKYANNVSVALMARWYAVTLNYFEGGANAREEFAKMTADYPDRHWWTLRSADRLSKIKLLPKPRWKAIHQFADETEIIAAFYQNRIVNKEYLR